MVGLIFKLWLAVAYVTVGLHYVYESYHFAKETVSEHGPRDGSGSAKH